MRTIYHSKTFWVAIVQSLIGAVTIFATAYPTIGVIIIAKSLLDIILRLLTVVPIDI